MGRPNRGMISISVSLLLLSAWLVRASDEPTDLSPLEPRPQMTTPVNESSEISPSIETAIRDLLEDKEKRQEAEKAKRETDGKKPTVNWTGQLQADMLMFTQDAASKAIFGNIPNGSAFRRARFGVFGQHELTEYRIEMDFAFAGRPTFLDVFAGVINPQTHGTLRVGHVFEPFSLERMTPNRYLTFLERSLMDQAFAPVRNLGVIWRRPFAQEDVTFALGMFRTDSDFYGDDLGDLFEHAITSRLTWMPYYRSSTGDHYLLVGASGSFRGANNHIVRFRAQPEVRIGAMILSVPFMADTGLIPATHSFLLGTEAIWVRGAFSVQAEYAAAPVASINSGTLWFQGWYVYVSYFLTGEHRGIRRDQAIMQRVIPKRPLFRTGSATGDRETGPGAWEVALRLSHLDLNSGAITGGRITELTAGLNWYLTPYMRMTSNYIHSFANRDQQRQTHTDTFGLRVGYDF